MEVVLENADCLTERGEQGAGAGIPRRCSRERKPAKLRLVHSGST